MKLIKHFGAWLAALIVASLPIVIAIDYGGVLNWTQYFAVITIVVAGVCALPTIIEQGNTGRASQLLLIPLAIWAVYAWCQTIPLPPTLVGWFSPASLSAYTEWIAPFLREDQLPRLIPISVDTISSRHAAAMLTALIGFIWIATVVMNTRARIGLLLLMAAVGVGLHAIYGFWCLVDPAMHAAAKSGFGTFVGRTSASLFLNFGLAASLGLLSWRLSALNGQEVDDGSFEFNDFFSLINDRDSILGVVCATLCLGGILACGSRAGVAAMLVGGFLALGWMRQRRGWLTIPVVGAVIGISVLLLLVPMQIGFKSLERISETAGQDKSTILRDGRLEHWGDGWSTATAHFPFGSGLSTYAYAYLPHQQTSPAAWFHHADNLWLELIVEQGVVGIALAIVILFLLVRALRRLADSSDPIDQGLRTAGWFALGALIFSQTFDFGLILPANLFLFALLFAAIVSRSDSVADVVKNTSVRRSLFPKRKEKVLAITCGVSAILFSAACLPKLHQDAVCEAAYRSVNYELESIRTDIAAMDRRLQAMHALLPSTSAPLVLLATAQLELERARMAEVVEANPPTAEDIVAAYKNTSPSVRRLRWTDRKTSSQPIRLDETTSESLRGYWRSLELSTQMLSRLPLSIDARVAQIYLDFVHQKSARTKAAIEQLAKLHARNPERLMNLAHLAADGGEMTLAASQWKEAVSQQPQMTYRAIEFIQNHVEITLDDVIPNLAENQRRASSYLLANAEKHSDLKRQTPEFLTNSLGKVACEQCQSNQELANCEELSGDILYFLNRVDDSLVHYQSAIKATPADANLRVKYIGRLHFAGRRDAARSAAILARRALPEHPRFQKIIDEMANRDLREVDSRQQK